MSLIPTGCTKHDEVRKINIAEQNGKEYRLTNTTGYKIRKIECDGCVEQGIGEKRCDYLIVIDEDNLRKVFFIELKGGDLSEALKQITNTIDYLKDEFKSFQKEVRIVGSKDVPGFVALPHYLKLAKYIQPGVIKRATNKVMNETI